MLWTNIFEIFGIAACVLSAGLFTWGICDFIRFLLVERRQEARLREEQVSQDLRDAIFQIAHELAQSQRESTQAMLRAAADHAKKTYSQP